MFPQALLHLLVGYIPEREYKGACCSCINLENVYFFSVSSSFDEVPKPLLKNATFPPVGVSKATKVCIWFISFFGL